MCVKWHKHMELDMIHYGHLRTNRGATERRFSKNTVDRLRFLIVVNDV